MGVRSCVIQADANALEGRLNVILALWVMASHGSLLVIGVVWTDLADFVSLPALFELSESRRSSDGYVRN